MSGSQKYSLTEGGILQKLLQVSLPLIGTQIIQMTYNLTDMFWLGRVGGAAVAASGTVGMFMWLSMAFLVFGSKGAEIGVSQNIGRGDRETARRFGETAVSLGLCLGLFYAAVLLIFRRPLIGFFNIQEPEVVVGAVGYLSIIGFGFPFEFLSAAITGIFVGSGNSRLPFIVNSAGLAINMALDPLLILTYDMGIRGAAIATLAAQATVCILMSLALLRLNGRPFERFRLFAPMVRQPLSQILRWVTPIAVESFLFTFLSMLISRVVAGYGADAMAGQRVGSQIESLSWLVGGGFAAALTAYVGQNFGARKWKRIRRGFAISTAAMAVYGAVITALMFFGARALIAVFVPTEPEVIAIGARYLRILSASQFVACLEGISAGAFRGMGRTAPPSAASITTNVLRVAAIYILSPRYGLDTVWWVIAASAALRSLWIYIWFKIDSRRLPHEDEEVVSRKLPCGEIME